ncbi:tetratricopeptide repeat protein [Embleya sp. NBC_00896]|uniref:tetratricopeptide repeat protein n=1 Tax=Embleya sp. NBC_00896 TaxID=2975961 RepID=UPI0038684D32|nr:tetratricopeptide repeat protein [Embleya sp. NBC_00896]
MNRQDNAAPDENAATAGDTPAGERSIAGGRDVVGSTTGDNSPVLNVNVSVDGPVTVVRAVPIRPVASVEAPTGLCNVPRVGLFVGRDDALRALDIALTNPGGVIVQAVNGLGGIGKSALAAHWARTRSGATPRWWITAEDPAAVNAGLAELGRVLQPALAEQPTDVLREQALQWLASHDDWLIVLDNVDDPEDVKPLLSRVNSGRFLITTRRATGWYGLATPLALNVLAEGEAVDLFIRILTHARPGGSDGVGVGVGVGAVCAELGHLPLAVEQAAAFCAETGTTPHAYLDMLARWPVETFAATAEGGDASRSIARIWRITLDRLTDTPLPGDILRILAWYAPNDIPRVLLTDLAPPPILAKAIGRLTAYSLITDNADGTLSVHRLVQTLARTPDPDDPHRRAADIDRAREHATALLNEAFPGNVKNPTAWPECRTLLLHIDALAQHTPHNKDTHTTATLLDQAAGFLLGQGAVGGAISHYERALAGRVRVLGEEDLDTLGSRNNLAYTYESVGDLGRAIPMLEAVSADSVRVLGEDHPNSLTSLNNLAGAYESAGDLARAIPMFEAVLAGRTRVLGEDHPDTLESRSNVAYTYESAGDPGRAIPMFEAVLAGRTRVLGEDHPDTLRSRNNLAFAYESTGDPRAISMLAAVSIDCVRVLGEEHPDTLIACNNLAAAYKSVGDPSRAIPMFEAVLAGRTRVLGEDHPDTLGSRNNLACVYLSAGDLGRAIPMLKAISADRVRVLGEDHPDTLTTRNNLAYAYHSAGNLGRAISMYEATLADRVRILGRDHPDTLVSHNNLACVYQEAGEPRRAVSMYEATLADRVRILGQNHPDTLMTRNNLAGAYQAAGDFGRAIPLREAVLADHVRVSGKDHPDTLTSRNNLAGAYWESGDRRQAVQLLKGVLADCVRVFGKEHPTTKLVRANLAGVRGGM